MKYSVKSASMALEILKRKLGAEYSKPVTCHSTAFSNGVVKAGTPLDKDGKISNDGSAVGILWNDVFEENPNGSLLVADAVVNKKNAEVHSGYTLASTAMSALSKLYFE